MAICNVSELVGFIQCELNDKQGDHWTSDDIFNYICLAAASVYNDDKDAFSEVTEVQLEPGCVQNLCGLGCGNFSGFMRIKGTEECTQPDKVDANVEQVEKYFEDICVSEDESDEGYKLRSYTVSNDDPCILVVDPAVPDDVIVTAIIGCSATPEIDRNGDLPARLCEKINMIVQLTLHYAYTKDNQANANLGRADTHFRNYLALARNEFEQELLDERDS